MAAGTVKAVIAWPVLQCCSGTVALPKSGTVSVAVGVAVILSDATPWTAFVPLPVWARTWNV